MDDIGAIASSAPMNDLYQKINKYVYEIQMMELEEYLYGMNRKNIDDEKAYDIIINAPDSDSNPLMLYWKARFADPKYPQMSNHISCRVEKNKSKAIALYKMAVELNIEGMAENGDKYACAYLGWMYRHGRGVIENCSKAVKWLRKAAEQGHADAQSNLGWMYYFGQGVDEDNPIENNATALEWYRKAAEQGHAYTQHDLGFMYEKGYCSDKNKSAAAEWYHQAAEQGHPHAQNDLDHLIYYSSDTGWEEE